MALLLSAADREAFRRTTSALASVGALRRGTDSICADGVITKARTHLAHYRLRASRVTRDPTIHTLAALVTCERLGEHSLDDAELRERFGLSPREIQVARLGGHRRAAVAPLLADGVGAMGK